MSEREDEMERDGGTEREDGAVRRWSRERRRNAGEDKTEENSL